MSACGCCGKTPLDPQRDVYWMGRRPACRGCFDEATKAWEVRKMLFGPAESPERAIVLAAAVRRLYARRARGEAA